MTQSSLSITPARSFKARNLEHLMKDLNIHEFDWKTFESTYTGRALINRLLSMAEILITEPSKAPFKALLLGRTALLRLIPLIKQETLDHQTYQAVVSNLEATFNLSKLPPGAGTEVRASGVRGNEEMDMDIAAVFDAGITGRSGNENEKGLVGEAKGNLDMEWLEMAMEMEKKENARLVIELNGYTSNLIKESIRLTHLAFAQLCIKTGSFSGALNHYMSAREYCSGPSHLVELGQYIIETSLIFNQVSSLPGHISKLEIALDRLQHPSLQSPSITGPGNSSARDISFMTASDLRSRERRDAHIAEMKRKIGNLLHVARGLVGLVTGDYGTAGVELSCIWDEGGLGEWEGKVISTSDTAIIAALCILASQNRGRIRHLLLEKQSFRSALDDANMWLLDLVRAYVDAQYGDVMALLHAHESTLIFLPYLTRHVQNLIHRIQISSLIQYIKPFSTVRLDTMGSAFGVSMDEIINQISHLAETGQIKAKLDLIDGIVKVNMSDTRVGAFFNAAKVGGEVEQMVRSATFRMKLIEADIKVDPRPKDAKKFRGSSTTSSLGIITTSGPVDVSPSLEFTGLGEADGRLGTGSFLDSVSREAIMGDDDG